MSQVSQWSTWESERESEGSLGVLSRLSALSVLESLLRKSVGFGVRLACMLGGLLQCLYVYLGSVLVCVCVFRFVL